MRPPTYAPGTKSPSTPSEYTDAQYRALDGLKETGIPLLRGAARAEFVNKVLMPDGTISDDLAPVRAAAAEAEQEGPAKLRAFGDAHHDEILAGTLSPELRVQLAELQREASHARVDELEDHLAQQRFLLVVDADNVVRIWFQCAVEHNPDVHHADGRSLAHASGARFPNEIHQALQDAAPKIMAVDSPAAPATPQET
jgi:hypothetical protein